MRSFLSNCFGILCTSILFVSLTAQDIDLEHFESIKARNIGPAGMSGRVTAIDVDLSNPQRIFVGTASGGLWFSSNAGISWTPIFDDQPNISIGAIKINQANPSEIWVGTGEGNPRNSQNSGAGVFKSIDGGRTWHFKGLKNTKTIHRIVIDETKSGVAFVGAQGSAWGPNEERGVFKTTDGGDSWQKILYVNNQTGVADMVMDPKNPNKIIVAMWEYGRKPWTFNSGGTGSGLHITHDGGKTWKRIEAEDGMPKGDLGRIGVAIAASNTDIVYALVEAKENALYKSTDGGAKWLKVPSGPNLSDRPFYYHEIYVDPKNENRLYSLFTYVSTSDDGGKTWKIIADYGNGVHPDHHAFWISPTDPNYLIDGNDGGLNISYDMGKNWRFVNNLPVGQFYHVNVDNEFPYNVYGGMQDNGSWAGPAFTLKSGGITNYDWQEVFFGDGFDVAPKPDDANYVYAMSQGGNMGLVDRTTGATRFIKPNNPGDTKLRYNWNAPLALDPMNNCGLYYGSQFVHYSADCGQSWVILSPDLTTNDTSKQHQDISGGLTYDATNAENNTTIIAIAPHPQDDKTILVGTDDGRLQITNDRGGNWTDVYSKLPGAPKAGWIPQIEWSVVDQNEAFVVLNNYRQNDWSAYLYHTRDKGNTWRRIVQDSQVGSFVVSVLQDPKEANLIFLGTDSGLYFSLDRGVTWKKWPKQLPNVQIADMKIQSTFDDLVLGTFGRAFWVIDDIGTIRQLARENYTTKDFDVVSVTPAYLSEYRSYQGIRFIAQAEFVGDDKSTDAYYSIWIKPETLAKMEKDKKVATQEKDKDKEKNKGKDKDNKAATDDNDKDKDKKPTTGGKKENTDKVKFTILNERGDTIRQFSRKVDKKGLVRMSWGLETNGTESPSPRPREKDADPPRGDNALPGIYKTIVNYGDQSDSIMVEIKMDPRLKMSSEDIADLKSAMSEQELLMAASTETYEKIKKAKKSLALIEKLTETLQDTTQKEIAKLNKEEDKKLAELHELFFNKDNQKGIQRNPEILTSYIFGARRYLQSSYGKPGSNAMIALDKAKAKYNEVKAKVDKYFAEDWEIYKGKIKSIDFALFED